MGQSRVFLVCAITLYLAACLCARANVTEEEARKAVEEAQQHVKTVLNGAKEILEEAADLVKDIQGYKKYASQALLVAQTVSVGNQKAEAMAKKAPKKLDKILKLYPEVYEKANKLVNYANETFSSGKKLNETTNNIWPGEGLQVDYTLVKKNASAAKVNAKKLYEKVVDALAGYVSVYYAHTVIPEYANDVQLIKCNVEAVVATDQVDTIFKFADTAVKEALVKREIIRTNVMYIYNMHKKCRTNLVHFCHMLFMAAETKMWRIARVINVTNKTKKNMATIKKNADDAHTKVKAEPYAEKAENELAVVKVALIQAKEASVTIKGELDLATQSVDYTVGYKNQAIGALDENKIN